MSAQCQAACEKASAVYAILWQPEGDVLKAAAHYNPPDRIAAIKAKRGDDKLFTLESYSSSFTKGQGAPGRVWASGEAELIPNASATDAFARKDLAAEFGICSVAIVPVADGIMEVGTPETWSAAPAI